MLAKVRSCALLGIDGIPLEIEVDIADGLPAFDIIGLPDASVREAKERVRAAIRNCGFIFPYSRVTVNLAPADLKKEGSSFDLAIAVGLLAATGQIPGNSAVEEGFFIGELSLDGKLRGINGTLAMALTLSKYNGNRDTTIFLPTANGTEGALVDSITVKPVNTLKDLVRLLKRNRLFTNCATV